MHWLAGSCGTAAARRPAGAVPVAGARNLWQVGDPPNAWVRVFDGRLRRIVVVGTCGASDADLHRLVASGVPDDVAWRWPGAYAVVEQSEAVTTIWTDLACAVPIYTTTRERTVYWSTTARGLAGLIGATIHAGRLAAELLAPATPLLAGHTTYFEGIDLVLAGHRLRISRDGAVTAARVWWPGHVAPTRTESSLRTELDAAVGVRVDGAASPSSDLSGGLDSSSLTLLAARRLSPDRSIAAFTVHAPFDQPAGDLRYSLDAAERPGVRHHLLPLDAGHLPYGCLDSVPPTDEPAPSTRAYARFAYQMTAMTNQVATDTHVTGDGGDSLLCTPDAWIADLIAARRYGEAIDEVVRLARTHRCPPRQILRDALDLLHSDPTDALVTWARLARGQTVAGRTTRRAGHWLPLPDHAGWATDQARHHAAELARAAGSAMPAPAGQRAVWDVVEQMAEVGRSAHADAQLAVRSGVRLHNPFADSRVIDSYLSTVAGKMPSPAAYKPVLRAEMAGVLPTSLLARTTKGVYTPDYHQGLRTHLTGLMDIADGHLVAAGLVDPVALISAIRRAAAGLTGGLWLLDAAITCETWLHAHHSTALPIWEDARENLRPGCSRHDASTGDTSSPRLRVRHHDDPDRLRHRRVTAAAGATARAWAQAPDAIEGSHWGLSFGIEEADLEPPSQATQPGLHAAATAVVALGITLAARTFGPAKRSMSRLTSLAGAAARVTSGPATTSEAGRAVAAVRWVARWTPLRVACLEESIAVVVFLAARRRRVTWCHGVAPDPVQFHAWIQTAGSPVAEPPTTSRYTILRTIP